MLERFLRDDPLAACAPKADAEAILSVRALCAQVEVAQDIRRYIVTLIDNTRKIEGVLLGASPRAMIALMRACQALALLNGRAFVTPDDVQFLASDALSHRLVMGAGTLDQGAARKAVSKAVEMTAVPREN